jgi:hypothetical protein
MVDAQSKKRPLAGRSREMEGLSCRDYLLVVCLRRLGRESRSCEV